MTKFSFFDVLTDEKVKEGVVANAKNTTNTTPSPPPSYPLVYINGVYVGGLEYMRALAQDKEAIKKIIPEVGIWVWVYVYVCMYVYIALISPITTPNTIGNNNTIRIRIIAIMQHYSYYNTVSPFPTHTLISLLPFSSTLLSLVSLYSLCYMLSM
jgi:hypothetical protein